MFQMLRVSFFQILFLWKENHKKENVNTVFNCMPQNLDCAICQYERFVTQTLMMHRPSPKVFTTDSSCSFLLLNIV